MQTTYPTTSSSSLEQRENERRVWATTSYVHRKGLSRGTEMLGAIGTSGIR